MSLRVNVKLMHLPFRDQLPPTQQWDGVNTPSEMVNQLNVGTQAHVVRKIPTKFPFPAAVDAMSQSYYVHFNCKL